MKKLSRKKIIIYSISISLIILMGMGYTVTRIRDLASTQAVYLDSAFVAVDYSSYSVHKKMYVTTLAPTIDVLAENTGPFDKDNTQMRVDIGTGVEYRTDLRNLVPDITDKTAGGSVATNDLIAYYDITDSRDEKVAVTTFVNNIGGMNAFTTAVDTRITETKILSEIQTSVDDQALINSGTTYGYISLRKIGDIVTGNVVFTLNTGGTPVAIDYTIPSALWPQNVSSQGFNVLTAVRSDLYDIRVLLGFTGSISLSTSAGLSLYPTFSFSYITD